MRELKFRAWYAPEKEYIYDVQDTYDNACEGSGSLYHENFREVLEDDDCTVEQYTSLKDKNGKKIYEGDIVQQGTISGGRFAVVKWIDANAKFIAMNIRNHRQMPFDGWTARAELMVVGNIHENPELLKEEE